MIQLWRRIKQMWLNSRISNRPTLDTVDFGSSTSVVLDIGANKGGFAGQALLRAPLAEIHCFEPNPELMPILQSTTARYGTNQGKPRCIIQGKGVGAEPGELELIVTGLHAASSFLPVANASREGWPTVDFREVARCRVPVIRICDYLQEQQIPTVKLMKLDVQGFELQVLKGCGERIRDIEYIMTEIQFQPLYDGAPLWTDILNFTRPFGFQPVVIDGFCLGPKGEPLQADLLLKNTRLK